MRRASFSRFLCACAAVALVSHPLGAQGRRTIPAGSMPNTTPAAAQTEAPAKESATEFYTRYKAAYAKATSMDEILAFMSADMVKQFNSMPAAQRPPLAMMKDMNNMYTDVKVVKETTTSKGVTLSLSGVDMDKKKGTGTVDLVKEKGAWKIGGAESWKS